MSEIFISMIFQEASRYIYYLNRGIWNVVPSPENLSNINYFVRTDFEGPLGLGDGALRVMSEYIHPKIFLPNSPDYGKIIYNATYDWYTDQTKTIRKTKDNKESPVFAQEGTDIVLALAPLLAVGVDQAKINQTVYRQFKRTPGSTEYLDFLKKNSGHIVAITTAWEEPHKIIAQELGLDGIVGTPFPIDIAKDLLMKSGHYQQEMEITWQYLNNCFKIIDQMQKVTDEQQTSLTNQLKERIGKFYNEQLGITYDVDSRRRRGPCKTYLGQIMEYIEAVGDRNKAAVARVSTRHKGTAAVITVGDGLNDWAMLFANGDIKEGNISIGLNGPEAAQAATFGLITPDVSVLIPAYQVFRWWTDGNRNVSLDRLLHIVQKEIGDLATIHLGGRYMDKIDQSLLDKHRIIKKQLRGEVIA